MENFKRVTLHIVYNNSEHRMRLARLAFAAGHHAEIYDDVDELVAQSSRGGVVLMHDQMPGQTVATLMAALARAGDWRPVIAFGDGTNVSAVVQAMRAGANDYLDRPDAIAPLNDAIVRALHAAEKLGRIHARRSEARQRMALLTAREREVLERIAAGCSNKIIARDLGLSPRTIEIHRMKMMGKLSARQSTEAVRIWIEAEGINAA